jgi:glycosyltransferase involved in cell wall biosynthesis
MKILFTQETDWLKRGPHQQHHLADRLSLRGHEIRVIDFDFMWREEREKLLFSKRKVFFNVFKIDDRAKVTIIRPGMIKAPLFDYVSSFFTFKKEIERQIKEYAPDIVVSFSIRDAYLSSKIAKRYNIPFAYYWIDVNHRLIPSKLLQPIGKMFEMKAITKAKKVLVINEKLGDYVHKLGAPRNLIKVIRAGIDIDKFDPDIKGDSIRQKYKISKKDVVIFFMGWLYNFSGLKETALKLGETNHDSLKMLIVGEGDAYDELKGIQEDHKLQDRIILAGKKSYQEIPDFIAAADICILPAYPWEPIMQDIVPIKLYEYMAMKKPVIVTRLPGVIKEFGNNNGLAYVDKPEDVIEKAISLISTTDITDLGAKARQFVENNSWRRITDEFESTLKEVIEQNK